jgi:hypothetical protein
MTSRELAIGTTVGAEPAPVGLAADVLTTHGVILGMTGSGKTGLAIVILEELARQGIPLIICDLKGDLTNLLLTFPDLEPGSFLPYLPDTAGPDRQAAAAAIADKWRQGLARYGMGPDTIREVKTRVTWQLLTPGSGVAPVNLLPALRVPDSYDPDTDPDGARSRLDGTVAGLLALVGRGGDPLSDRDHVLLATILDTAWRAGHEVDLPGLLRQVAEPPVTQFGVLDAETFYPRHEREDLLQALNVMLASPSFAVWTRGMPLSVADFVGAAGAPRATILYLAHLGDRERLSFLTLLFTSLLSWVRAQRGTEALRVLTYIDEVQGILPPTAMPPTKPPLLTLLKQGRAFGAGVMLATQNPVDLDYKALGNIGLKLLGRLDTEKDRSRALEGLDLADPTAEATVAALQPRQFLLAGPRVGPPRVLTSRWAMSYLRGPMTLAELKPLVAPAPRPAAGVPPSLASQATTAPLLPGVTQLYGTGENLSPAMLFEGRLLLRKASPAVQLEETGPWLVPFGPQGVAWERLTVKQPAPLQDDPPAGVTFAPLPSDAADRIRTAGKDLLRELVARGITVLWHRALKLAQQDGETADGFRRRCVEAAQAKSGSTAEQTQRRYEEKIRAIDAKLSRETDELARDRQEVAARERQEQISVAAGVGDTILSGLGVLLGGRRSGIGTAVRRGASTAKQWTEKQRLAERARGDVAESEQTIAALEAERARLQGELDAELQRLTEDATAQAALVESLTLQPAAKDITVRRVCLVWLPAGELD